MVTSWNSKRWQACLQLCPRVMRSDRMKSEILKTILEGLNVVQRLIDKMKGGDK